MKVQFSSHDIRYRLTEEDLEKLQKENILSLNVAPFFLAKIQLDKNLKQEYMLEAGTPLILTLHPSMLEEVPCDAKNGLVWQQKNVRISIAIDLKAKHK